MFFSEQKEKVQVYTAKIKQEMAGLLGALLVLFYVN